MYFLKLEICLFLSLILFVCFMTCNFEYSSFLKVKYLSVFVCFFILFLVLLLRCVFVLHCMNRPFLIYLFVNLKVFLGPSSKIVLFILIFFIA